MSRRRRRSDAQNLDSLLDTMANVTGILVVLLAATQISAGDAMGRLRELLAQRPELSPASLARVEDETRTLRAELAPLRSEHAAAAARRRDARAELAALRERNAALHGEVELGRSAGSSDRRLHELRAREERLRADLDALRGEVEALAAAVDASADATLQRSERLPDQRPAPAGARLVHVMGRYARIAILPDEALVAQLWRGIEQVLGGARRPASLGLLTSLERVRLSHHFDRARIGAGDFHWAIPSHGELAAELVWNRRSTGEAESEIARAASDFQRELGRLDSGRVALQYYVWQDSFDVYRAARRLSDARGFAAGWDPRPDGAPITLSLTRRAPRGFVD